MRLGIVRGDIQGPVFLNLEPVSQYRPPTEPRGQEVYVSRPTVAEVEAVLANATTGAGAIIRSSDLTGTFPITINASNDDLKVRTNAAVGYTTVLVPQAVYANITTLLAAVNEALRGTGIVAIQANGAGIRLGLEGAHGVSSYVAIDSVAGGSVANTPLGLGAAAVVRDMPSAATYITALLPVGGPLDVSTVTIDGVGAGNNANALSLVPVARGTQEALADAIAPQLVETPVVIDSFLTGQISELLSVVYNPDSRRRPPLVAGAAAEAVQDDGVTPFVATLPTIVAAGLNVPTPGDLTITGTGLGDAEMVDTTVRITGTITRTLVQQVIEVNGGSVSGVAVVIPAVLIPGAATVTTFAQVKVRQRMSGVQALA